MCTLMLQKLVSIAYFSNGAIAKIVATVVTYPLQVVQTRLRVSFLPRESIYNTPCSIS